MNELERDTILMKIYQGQQEIKEQVEELRIKEIPIIKKQLKEIPVIKKQLKEIPVIKKQLKEIPVIKEELRSISRTVAKMEVEHAEKLQALFDAFSLHSEKLQTHEKRIDSCEHTIERQDDEIYYLKSKVQGL